MKTRKELLDELKKYDVHYQDNQPYIDIWFEHEKIRYSGVIMETAPNFKHLWIDLPTGIIINSFASMKVFRLLKALNYKKQLVIWKLAMHDDLLINVRVNKPYDKSLIEHMKRTIVEVTRRADSAKPIIQELDAGKKSLIDAAILLGVGAYVPKRYYNIEE